jgi:predicted PurR-regulated permease PerM
LRTTPGTIALCVLAIAAATVVVAAFEAVAVLFAGALFALFLRAISRWIARALRIPYALALAVVVLLGLSATAVGAVLLAPSAEAEFQELSEELPAALDRVKERLRRAPIVGRDASAAVKSPRPKSVQNVLQRAALAAIGNSVELIAGLLVVFFVGVYGAAQPRVYESAVLALLPDGERPRARRALHKMAEDLTRWLLGRCVAMLFVGVTTGIAFHLFRLPLAAALGVFAGLLTFVEYAGAVISAVPPLLLALAQSPTTAATVLALYTGLHVIEGYVLTPLLARASVRLPPAIALSSQILLGTLAGPLGLTFSTPLLVVVISTVRAFREQPPDL